MKKTLTAALALSTFAGLALATSSIDTPKAGCISVPATSSMFVLNPFTQFEGSSLTLGDIDGSASSSGFVRVLTARGKAAFDVYWSNTETPKGWYTLNEQGTEYVECKNSYPLERGASVMFVYPSSGSSILTNIVSGVLNTNKFEKPCVQGQNFVGNVVPVPMDLTDFSISGDFDPWTDYVATANGTKYVYDDGSWYLRSDYLGPAAVIDPIAKNAVVIGAGEGFRLYTPRTNPDVTITLPGL